MLDLAAGVLAVATTTGLVVRTDPVIAFRLGYIIGRRRRLRPDKEIA